MTTKVVAEDDHQHPYITDLLNTLFSMQKTSSYTDCTLISSDGTPVQAHLPMLSLSWPRLEQLLPPSDGLCNCQCCVPGITLSGEAETVQALLELVYTGRTGELGVEGERKVMQLLEVLGIEWVLERVENELECNNNKSSEKFQKMTEGLTFPGKHKADSPNKESLEDGLLISPVSTKEVVKKSLCNHISENEDVWKVNDRRKSIPREVKTKKPVLHFKSPDLIQKKNTGESFQPIQPSEKKAVKVGSTRPLQLPENNEHVEVVKLTKSLDIYQPSDVVRSVPEIKIRTSQFLEKELSLTSVQVTESVAAVQKTMIAPGTLMTKVDNCIRFFCSYCEVEMTKFTKAEKETHWAVVHFSEELSKFTHHGEACTDCNMKVENEKEMVKHVGVFHKKIYNFLSVLPSILPDRAKQSPVQKPSELFNPSRKFHSRVVSVKPGSHLKTPIFFVKCTLHNPIPQTSNHQLCAQNHLTKAVLEEGTVLSESLSSKFPLTNQRWYYTCFSSNNNLNLTVLTSLVSHYSSLLGEEDPAKCPFCPHLKDHHVRLSLHESVEEFASAEGRHWCGVCCQQVSSEEQFQHHLATHMLTCMDKPGTGEGFGQGSSGRKDFHVFFYAMSTCDPEIRLHDDSTGIVDAGGIMKEETSLDSIEEQRCNICEKVLSCPRSLKRHMNIVHSKGNLKKASNVNLDNSDIMDTGPVQNKDLDFCDGVINSKCNDDLLETFGVGFGMNDKNSLPQVEEKGCKAVKIGKDGNESEEIRCACIICNITFSSNSRVNSHLALCHFKEKIMQEMTSDLNCALCDRAFKVNSVLVMHVGSFHNRSETFLKEYMDSLVEKNGCEALKLKSKEEEKSEENKPACPICNMTLASNYRVKAHLAGSHFKEKIMQEMTSDLDCALCDRVFFKNSELVMHVGCYHNRSETYLKEHMDSIKQMDWKYMSERDVLIASFEDEINLNSIAGFVCL